MQLYYIWLKSFFVAQIKQINFKLYELIVFSKLFN